MIQYLCDKCREPMASTHPDRQLQLVTGGKKLQKDYCESCFPDVQNYIDSPLKVAPLMKQQSAFAEELSRVANEIRGESANELRLLRGQFETACYERDRMAAEKVDLAQARDSYKGQAESLQADLAKLNGEFETYRAEVQAENLFHPETEPPPEGDLEDEPAEGAQPAAGEP